MWDPFCVYKGEETAPADFRMLMTMMSLDWVSNPFSSSCYVFFSSLFGALPLLAPGGMLHCMPADQPSHHHNLTSSSPHHPSTHFLTKALPMARHGRRYQKLIPLFCLIKWDDPFILAGGFPSALLQLGHRLGGWEKPPC